MKSYFTPALLCILLASSLAAQDYAIKLQHPLTVGQRFEYRATADESMERSMISEQRTLKTEKEELKVELESVATILEVDAKGRSLKESHQIVKLLEGTNQTPLLAAGTIVVASRSGKKAVFNIAGTSPPNAVINALVTVIDIASGGPTDDELFGTKERKKVGDSWPLDEALASREAKEKFAGLGMSMESMKGMTTLQSVSHEGGTDVIHVASDVTATMVSNSKGPFALVKGNIKAYFSGAFPEDITKHVSKSGTKMTASFELSGQPAFAGPVVRISCNATRSGTRQSKLLK